MHTKGYAVATANTAVAPFSFERRDIGPNDVLIDIQFCGICHADIHQARDATSSIFPMVPGHEIAGRVAAVGGEVTKFKIGDSVGVGCLVDSCRACSCCQLGMEQFCVQGATPTYNGLERDGKTPTMGGYSDKIVVDQDFVLRIPETLAPMAAAPLLCAGITMYSPLKHWRVGPGSQVAIVGLGGLGHLGVKLAHAFGAEVTVFSHSSRKRDEAQQMGADHFLASSEPKRFTELRSRFDLIICTVSADLDWNQYLSMLRVDGAMVVVGVPQGAIPVSASALFTNRRSLSGSLIGGIRQTQEMLNFCGRREITPNIELISIQQVNEAYERILRSDVRYRFVIDMATL